MSIARREPATEHDRRPEMNGDFGSRNSTEPVDPNAGCP